MVMELAAGAPCGGVDFNGTGDCLIVSGEAAPRTGRELKYGLHRESLLR